MTGTIAAHAAARGITRLCHFTPSRSLAHILADRSGILPSRQLSAEERGLFNPTDLLRLDNHTSHICCSIEYPNGWYMAKVRADEVLFPDWVVLLVKPDYLWADDTLFCPRNAAAGGGRHLRAGVEAFDAMFPPSVSGAYGKDYPRVARHLPCSPTDDQAEVLVPGRIPVEDIIGIAVSTETQGLEDRLRLEYCGVDVAKLKFIVAPTLFNKAMLSRAIRNGSRPVETPLAP